MAAVSRVAQQAAKSSARGYATAVNQTTPPLLEVTTLPSGVRVATESTPGHFAALGLYVDCGSRYETQETQGVSHLLDRMSFSSSRNRTPEQMTTEIGSLGGQFSSTSSRETMIYQATSYSHALPQALSILSDTALNPIFNPDEIDAQRDAAAWEIQEIRSKPELIMPELLHQTAYSNKTLGNSLLCPEDRLDVISPDLIRAFHEEWYRPERIVVAAAGVNHKEFVNLVDTQLTSYATSSKTRGQSSVTARLKPSSSSRSFIQKLSTSSTKQASHLPSTSTPEAVSSIPAIYTGGTNYISDPSMEFTHLYIGYESFSVHQTAYIYPLAVLQTLLGGGGSFSAGGPGKGMYSKLYTSVLNRYHQVDFCSAFHHTYNDSGLFGINIAVMPGSCNLAPRVIANELENLTVLKGKGWGGGGGISEVELKRAKNQLKSMLMMALESRSMQVEDLARQVQAQGYKVPVEEMCAKADAVTLQDIAEVANLILRSGKKPTILAKGRLEGLPDVEALLRAHGLA